MIDKTAPWEPISDENMIGTENIIFSYNRIKSAYESTDNPEVRADLRRAGVRLYNYIKSHPESVDKCNPFRGSPV